jgi:hypothetical protein
VGQPSLAAVQQCIEKLQDARMSSDHTQRARDLGRGVPPQSGQALHELARLGVAQRPDGDLAQPGLGVGNRIAARDQQPPARRTARELFEKDADVSVAIRAAADHEVLFEVVEDEQHGVLGESCTEEPEAYGFIEVVRGQHARALAQLRAIGLDERRPDGDRDSAEVETPAVRGDRPAPFFDTLHHASGDRTLPNPAHPGENRAGIPPLGVAQRAQRLAQLLPPPDQIVDAQLRDRTRHLVHRPLSEWNLVEREVRERRFLTCDVERSGRVFGLGLVKRRASLNALDSLALELLARLGERAAGDGRLAAREVFVERAGELRRVVVAHRRLHGQHRGDAGAEQRLGEARRLLLLHAAVARAQEYQRQRLAGAAERIDELARRDVHGPAILVFELEQARAAVTREMEDVVRIALDRLGDHVRMADLEDPNLHVLVPLRLLHGVEDVLKLLLVVEHRGAGVPLVRSADRGEDFDRSRERRPLLCGDTRGAPHGHDGRQRREEAIVRQA